MYPNLQVMCPVIVSKSVQKKQNNFYCRCTASKIRADSGIMSKKMLFLRIATFFRNLGIEDFFSQNLRFSLFAVWDTNNKLFRYKLRNV